MEWEWDGRRLVVRNDRYGFFPIFYHATDDQIIVSDSIAKLIEEGAPADFDDVGLSVFLRLQTFVGDDTPFQKIRQLPPGAELVWSPNALELRTSRPETTPVRMSRDDAVATYSELFRRAVERRLFLDDPRKLVMPLSGGQDSRHIFLELIAQGRPPSECVTVARTWSPKLSEDARVAARLSAIAGVPHTVLSEEKDLFSAERGKNRLTSFCSSEHSWFLPLADYLEPKGSLVLDGIAGDVLSAGMFLNPEFHSLHQSGKLKELADRLLGDEHVFRAVLSPEFYQRVGRGRAVARLVEELERHAGSQSPITQFTFWNRTRRSIAPSPYAILGRVAGVDSPFLDHELHDFLAGLPVELLVDRRFHGDTIQTAYPRFAAIPFSTASGPLFTRATPFSSFARRLVRSLLSKPGGMGTLLSKGYVVPRLARCVLDPNYAMASSWLLELVVYLNQLASLGHESATRHGDVSETSPVGT